MRKEAKVRRSQRWNHNLSKGTLVSIESAWKTDKETRWIRRGSALKRILEVDRPGRKSRRFMWRKRRKDAVARSISSGEPPFSGPLYPRCASIIHQRHREPEERNEAEGTFTATYNRVNPRFTIPSMLPPVYFSLLHDLPARLHSTLHRSPSFSTR